MKFVTFSFDDGEIYDVVLLKNDDNILPLKSGKIVVSGSFAEEPHIGGGGSSAVKTEYKQRGLAELIKERIG